jgi:hypothetical protein
MPEPLYFLAAAPKEQIQVPTLTHSQGVRQFLELPPYGRYEGWNLATLERAELRSGSRLHIQNGERKFIDLDSDGTLTVIGAFDGFLGWGRWDFSKQPKVNGLAVIEFTYEFASFYERLLREYAEPRPAEIRFSMGIRYAHFEAGDEKRKLILTPGPVGERRLEGRRHEIREPSFEESIEIKTSAETPYFDVGKITYQLVRRFYNRFGLTDDVVPYTNETHEAIDITQIKSNS